MGAIAVQGVPPRVVSSPVSLPRPPVVGRRSSRVPLRSKAPALPALLLLALLGSAAAHRFFWNPAAASLERAYPVDMSQLSSFVVGELAEGETAFYRLPATPGFPLVFAVLAPIACPDFVPELWLVGRSLRVDDPAPFDLPEGFRAERLRGVWQTYRDGILDGRLGPHLRARMPSEDIYFAVHAASGSGPYIALRGGIDGFGGDPAGLDALGRFARCELAEPGPEPAPPASEDR